MAILEDILQELKILNHNITTLILPNEYSREERPIKRITIAEAIRQTLKELQPGDQFDIHVVIDYIQTYYPDYGYINRETIAIKLKQLRENGEITLIKQGSGRRPSLYQKN